MGVLFFMNYVLEKLVSMPPYKPNSCKCITSWLISLGMSRCFIGLNRTLLRKPVVVNVLLAGLFS